MKEIFTNFAGMNITSIISFALALICFAAPASAQTYYDEDYDFLYDYDHRIVVRKPVACTQDYQDLWNGDYVRLSGSTVYIYRGSSRFTYGESVWLMHNGQYIVSSGGYKYLLDENGRRSRVYGREIRMFWNGVCQAYSGSYWQLYTSDGDRLGNIYSYEPIKIYWNGTYCYKSGSYYEIADERGYRISGAYSDKEPILLNSGDYRVWRGSYAKIVTP